MKCLRKYQWVKLPRDIPDMGKGLMAYWAMLAFRAAFRKGNASYCGHSNPVAPGMWAGGVVGLKSILGVRSRTKALQILGELSSLGFLKYSLDSQTKKLTYEITDWVVKCSGAECMSGTVYASTGYGFLCLPRNITQRLANAKRVFLIVVIGAGIVIYVKVHEKFSQNQYDDRGFTKSKAGTYGTADWMTEKELKSVLELSTPERATGMILGERKGQLVCLPENTRLNRHCAIFGASGTMKSRAVIRNALFSIIRRGESALIADPKSEMYSDTSELFRKNGYEVKVLNLVDPLHGDSWNCMSDLNGNTMMAQVLTNVIIGNTSNGKSDHFWDNGEANLLKALVLYTDLDKTLPPERKNLAYVYQLLTHNSEKTLTIMFEKLPPDHPARAPFNLFSQSSDTVKSGIILGLGTRLQVLQNEAVKQLVSFSDIDLTAPGSHKCAYYIILSDQETSMAFLSSLFFSFLFIKLTRFADLSPGGRCPVPVNLILDEFNNIGRIGGAPDGSDFCRSLSVIRSRDIRVMLAVQSLGQLQNRYPNNLWSEIIGNCDIQLMLGCTDDVTADYISDRSGEMCIVVDSTMTVKKTVAVTQVIPQYRETQGQGKRKLLTPDEVLRLPHEQMLVIIRGQNLLLLNKFDYTRHPMSKEMVRASIMDYCPRTSYAPTPQTGSENEPDKKPQRESRGRKLSRSDTPPVEF